GPERVGALQQGGRAAARHLARHRQVPHRIAVQETGRAYSHRGRGEGVRAPPGRVAVAGRSLVAVSLLLFGLAARAAYPEKPVRFIVPSAPGGSVDVLMRILTPPRSA